MTLEDQLTDYSHIARDEIRKDFGPRSCVPSTWITLRVMQRLGFSASPLVVQVHIFNAAYLSALSRNNGIDPTPEENAEWTSRYGTWAIGIGLQSPGETDGIGGHVVATVEGRYLVDASIDQANVPERGIVVPKTIVTPLTPLFIHGIAPLTVDVDGIEVRYFLHRLPAPLESLPEWGDSAESEQVVERIMNLLNQKEL